MIAKKTNTALEVLNEKLKLLALIKWQPHLIELCHGHAVASVEGFDDIVYRLEPIYMSEQTLALTLEFFKTVRSYAAKCGIGLTKMHWEFLKVIANNLWMVLAFANTNILLIIPYKYCEHKKNFGRKCIVDAYVLASLFFLNGGRNVIVELPKRTLGTVINNFAMIKEKCGYIQYWNKEIAMERDDTTYFIFSTDQKDLVHHSLGTPATISFKLSVSGADGRLI
jgi:hypothetical protein